MVLLQLVDQSTKDPKFEDSNPAAASTGRKLPKRKKIFFLPSYMK